MCALVFHLVTGWTENAGADAGSTPLRHVARCMAIASQSAIDTERHEGGGVRVTRIAVNLADL